MQAKGWTLLRSLLNKFGHRLSPESFREVFLSDLPEEEAQKILHLDVSNNQPDLIIKHQEKMLQTVHYSWLLHAIEAMPLFLRSHMVGLLSEKTRSRISEKLNIEPKSGSYIRPVRNMILGTFLKYFDSTEVLPRELLAVTPLTPLLSLSKEDFVILIDLLGIHDLAEEMRGIVDQKKIKAVYQCLKPHQHRHLYLCLHQQEKVTSAPLELAGWNGNCNTLQKKLHVRGLIRLSKALSGHNPDFIWHVERILDCGRASVLRQHIHDEAIPKVTPALQQQVLQTLNYLNGKSEK